MNEASLLTADAVKSFVTTKTERIREQILHGFIYKVRHSLHYTFSNLVERREQGSTVVRLEVKHHHQPRELYCIPTSLKMAIDYTFSAFHIKSKVLSISKIAKMTKTTSRDGTAPKAVENINEFLRKAKPPISVRYREGGKFPQIDKEVNEKHLPVIVLLNQVSLPKTVWHAVVVIDYDPENHMVFYDDPRGR